MSDSTITPRDEAGVITRPTLSDLFCTFAGISLSGFGAPMPWARRMIVERKNWMSAEEFNETFALSQFLPGPNMVNFSVVFGARFGGVVGAAAALSGFLGPPLIVISVLAVLYARYGDQPMLGHILSGIAASAAGLLIAAVAKMLMPLFERMDWRPLVAILAFAGVAIMRWPLQYVFIALAPFSVALAWKYRAARK
jgi:chromate transporter